ncbi:MAG: IS4 family transposase, partial [Cyanobacteria bacterium P01_A01_bin.37]
TGGYHLEDTKVNDRRFLALVVLIVLAYSLATMHGQRMQALRIDEYAGCIKKHPHKIPHQSDFSLGLYGHRWLYAMEIWAEWAFRLIALKPHKRLYFQRGFLALPLMEQTL